MFSDLGINHFTQIFCSIGIIMLLQANYYEFTGNGVDQNYWASGSNTADSYFRFHGFEPRFIREINNKSSEREGSDREGRGFQFHADGTGVTVDMEFIVPFGQIPVQRSMALAKTTFRNLVNLNKGALLWTGAFVAIGAIILGIIKVLNTPLLYSYQYKKQNRAEDALSHFSLPHYTKETDDKNVFLEPNESNMSDFTSCIQKSICAYIERAAIDISLGRASTLQKIIDGLTSIENMSYLEGTAIKNAIDAGRTNQKCDFLFGCKRAQIEQKTLQFMLQQLNRYN